ncbi:MAG: hypothetical protein KatS3mg060_3426 [Dehalococcoidia bacterium]|nr:MAG: hypothetical protein KatS3mg060_3426 [Dehalococcoidia bacterium]
MGVPHAWARQAMVVFFSLSHALTPAGAGAVDVLPAGAAAPIAEPPLAARYAVSAAIGRDLEVFHAQLNGGRAHFQNLAHGLRAIVDGGMLEVEAGADRWSARLASWGRGANWQPLDFEAPRGSLNRVEAHSTGLTAWVQNGPLGIQQGWTIETRPPGEGVLGLRVRHAGTLRGVIEADRRGLALTAGEGWTALRWTGLLAWDATGRELPAWLEGDGDETVVRVNDDAAVYPVTVDPWVQAARLTVAGALDGDELGVSIAISSDGSTIVAGAPHCGCSAEGGRAYVFLRPSGGWTTTSTFAARLGLPAPGAGDRFGVAVALSADGRVIVVGAPNDDSVATNGGAAYVYLRPASGWTSTNAPAATLTAAASQPGDTFGLALALSGDGSTLAVGAPGVDLDAAEAGAVYVFLRPPAGWATTNAPAARLTAFDGLAGDSFGLAVAVSFNGDTIVVGAPNADAPDDDCGALYAFTRPAGGWVTTSSAAKLLQTDPDPSDFLGWAVAISADGTTIAGGTAYFFAYPGGVFLFVRPASGWVSTTQPTARITADSESDGAGFGTSLALSADGGLLVVGALYATGQRAATGAVFVYTRPTGGWTSTSAFTQKLVAADGAIQDQFGAAIAVTPDGASIAVGANNFIQNSGEQTGAAYVFVRPTIGGISPASGSPGTVVTIDGVNLEGATSVRFGGTAALSTTIVSSSRILATVAFGSSGLVEVESRGIVAAFGPFTFVPGPTTTAIAGVSPSPARVGESVVVSFTVSSALGPPTGRVRVFDGAASCTATVAEGRCSLTFGSAGRKTLRAEFEGSSAFAGSTSLPVSIDVKNPTKTQIVEVGPNPSILGQNVVVRFDVDAAHGTPTGTVVVSDGRVSCQAPVLAAQCALPSTVAGVRTIRASYLGEGDFLPSTSNPIDQTVLAPTPTPDVTPAVGTPTPAPSPTATRQPDGRQRYYIAAAGAGSPS